MGRHDGPHSEPLPAICRDAIYRVRTPGVRSLRPYGRLLPEAGRAMWGQEAHNAARNIEGGIGPRETPGVFLLLLQKLGTRFDEQAIDNNFDGVVLALVELRRIIELDEFAIDAGADEAVLRQFFHYCAERRHTQMDFGGLVPTVRRYRHAQSFRVRMAIGCEGRRDRSSDQGVARVHGARDGRHHQRRACRYT